MILKVRDKLCLDVKTVQSVDKRATWTVSIEAILVKRITLHFVVALRFSVANTASTGVRSNVEAISVGFHNINAWAHGVVFDHGVLSALVTGLDEVDACSAATDNGADIDVVHDAATSDTGLVDVIDGVLHGVLEEHS